MVNRYCFPLGTPTSGQSSYWNWGIRLHGQEESHFSYGHEGRVARTRRSCDQAQERTRQPRGPPQGKDPCHDVRETQHQDQDLLRHRHHRARRTRPLPGRLQDADGPRRDRRGHRQGPQPLRPRYHVPCLRLQDDGQARRVGIHPRHQRSRQPRAPLSGTGRHGHHQGEVRRPPRTQARVPRRR